MSDSVRARIEAKSVRDLSVEEFKALIETTVREAIEGEIEDEAVLKSSPYIASIVEARKDFAEGKAKSLSDLFADV